MRQTTSSVATIDRLINRLVASERPILFGHERPDGDAVGAALGLMWLLRGLGKRVTVSFADPLSANLSFLPGAETVADLPVADHDLIVALDGSDERRYGANFSAALNDPSRPPLIAIDHHKTNTGFADESWVDSRFAATAQMVYALALQAAWPVDQRAATCLATGCVTDTNAFTTDHTTPELLDAVASLMRRGAPLADIIREGIALKSEADAMLWGRVLATATIEDGVAYALSRLVDRNAVNASEGDGSGIVSFLRNVRGVALSILFVEQEDGQTRLSFRSNPDTDVAALALEWGGGGHAQAAGATVALPLDEAVAQIVPAAKRLVSASHTDSGA
ncbi:MAG: bifunctional oligoribonuclease/PAP phosphatase NrnA [Anaerolineales bacterium]|nr:bifunctional oligoribonuclease/PAP phosphatase NrnA [Anaerolineales bacterium]MCB9128808.1 bifunctional oligoribonuclease/PAP phosphatase NrnA [Ardenticatenales bacterium]MCB9171372.1 bifunctional oligoribonuclease/PAP phosphatase NrnA [Ardenticatenales bacterium]